MTIDQPSGQSLDFTSCDREPIHIPGSIQPHGVLLVVDPDTLVVQQLGGGTDRLLGRPVDEVRGMSLGDLLGTGPEQSARGIADHGSEPVYLGAIRPDGLDRSLDVTAHRSARTLVIELEPAPARPATASEILAETRRINTRLERASDLHHLCDVAAEEMRRLTGFDRVMVYQFLEDDTGKVVAEARRGDLDPLLNQHFPATDIPKQARALYLRNLIRVIPDVGYEPAPLVPAVCPMTGAPLDLSDCSLRSVSPVHVQYLKNMGVAASMSVSLVCDGRLWGLVACHHTDPKLVPYETRQACKLVGEVISQQICAREELERHRERHRFAAARDRFIGTLASARSLNASLIENREMLLTLLPAHGAAIRVGDEIALAGRCPGPAQVRAVTDWVLGRGSELVSTDRLPAEFAPATEFGAAASGIAATVVSSSEPLLALWFRAEQIEVVEWGGNPHKPALPGEEPGLLNPRVSFEAWKETVRGRSRAWRAAEIDAVHRLRRALVELRQAERLRELNSALRRTLTEKEELVAQKEILMKEAYHRVQNSLQIVNSMLQLQIRETTEPQIRDRFMEASQRILAVSNVHRHLWQSDQIEEVDFGAYLESLVDGLAESWGDDWRSQITLAASPVLLRTSDAVVVAVIVTELMTNAVKYAYHGKPGPLHVEVGEVGPKSYSVSVRDRGIGMNPAVRREGLGTRLITMLVAQLGGELRATDTEPGTRISLLIPGRA